MAWPEAHLPGCSWLVARPGLESGSPGRPSVLSHAPTSVCRGRPESSCCAGPFPKGRSSGKADRLQGALGTSCLGSGQSISVEAELQVRTKAVALTRPQAPAPGWPGLPACTLRDHSCLRSEPAPLTQEGAGASLAPRTPQAATAHSPQPKRHLESGVCLAKSLWAAPGHESILLHRKHTVLRIRNQWWRGLGGCRGRRRAGRWPEAAAVARRQGARRASLVGQAWLQLRATAGSVGSKGLEPQESPVPGALPDRPPWQAPVPPLGPQSTAFGPGTGVWF